VLLSSMTSTLIAATGSGAALLNKHSPQRHGCARVGPLYSWIRYSLSTRRLRSEPSRSLLCVHRIPDRSSSWAPPPKPFRARCHAPDRQQPRRKSSRKSGTSRFLARSRQPLASLQCEQIVARCNLEKTSLRRHIRNILHICLEVPQRPFSPNHARWPVLTSSAFGRFRTHFHDL